MATTPSRPRQSTSRIGIPTPVKAGSGIPTPGRSRSSSRAGQSIRTSNGPDTDSDLMARAFQQAIRSRDPRDQDSLAPASTIAGRPGSVASSSSATSAFTPRSSLARPKTPTQVRQPQNRPQSRQSDVFRASSRTGSNKPFEPGDHVRIESLGYEGTLRYIGSISSKPGIWAGVELSVGFAGLGKNDGSVDGIRYFDCPPKGGVFVALNKLSVPPIRRPTSVISQSDGRSTPANSLSGRITPIYNTPSARPRQSKITVQPPPSNEQFSAGSRASKYANMTAERLRNAANAFNNSPSTKLPSSPISAPSSDHSPSRQGRGSPTRTPKPSSGRFNRPSEGLASPARIDFVTPKPVSRSSTSGSLESPTRSSLTTTYPDQPISSSPKDVEDASILTELRHLVESQKLKIESLENEKIQANDEKVAIQRELNSLSNSMQLADIRIKELSELSTKIDDLEGALAIREAGLEDKDKLLAESKSSLNELQNALTVTEQTLKHKLQQSEECAKQLEKSALESEEQYISEKKYLNSQVDELRAAGQETIALYEDRLSANEDRRYELEELVSNLQEKVAALTRPLSPATMARHASEAAQIDNESLREQVAHLQKRINLLEEKAEEAKLSAETEEAKLRQELNKHRDTEVTLQKEIEACKTQVDEEKREANKAKSRTVEVEEALKEGASALENTRAEVEVLRAELTVWQNSGEVNTQASTESVEILRAEIQRLLQAAEKSADKYSSLQEDHSELRDELQAVSEKAHLLTQISEELQATINEQQTVIEKYREDGKAFVGSPEKETRGNRHDLAEKREEIAGLKRIVQQLSQDNAALNSQVKIIEAERDLLDSEIKQLREELSVLENKVEHSTTNYALTLASDGSQSSSTTEIEAEIIDLRRKLVDQDQKNARVIHDLNKEISELETLVESKIYREDELERELERYKEKASRSSKKPRQSRPHTVDNLEQSSDPSTTNERASPTKACEICEQSGHDIFTCPILQGDKSASTATPASQHTRLWCEDCERPGHIAANCPHSMDVF